MRTTSTIRLRAIIATGLTLAAVAAAAGSAFALSVLDPPGATTTLSNTTSGEVSTYEFATYTTAGTNRQVREFSFTFPAGSDVSGATLISHTGVVTTSGTNVHVTFDPRIQNDLASFTIIIGDIVNGDPGVYSGLSAEFLTTNPGGRQEQTHSIPVGPFTIYQAPFLSVTLSSTLVEFELRPDITTPDQQVTLTVDSSHPYTVTREVTGEADLFGLTVAGDAEGPKPAGMSVLTDIYSAQVPWTTEGDSTYAATVTYTVVQ